MTTTMNTGAASLSDEQILEHFEMPGLNLEATLDAHDIGLLLTGIRALLARQPAAIDKQEAAVTREEVEQARDRILEQSKNSLFRSGVKICAGEILSPIEACDKPPAGWKCSRTKGHEGPCAASLAAPSVEQDERAERVAAFKGWFSTAGIWNDAITKRAWLAACEWMQARAASTSANVAQGATSHERIWLENRANIISAINAAGFELSSNKDGWWLAKRPADKATALAANVAQGAEAVPLADRDAVLSLIESYKEDLKAANERLELVASINSSYVQEITALRSRVATLKAAVDAEPNYLPCPICKGVEGCDHTVPERRRAAENPIYQSRVSGFDAAWRDVSKEIYEDVLRLSSYDARIVYAAPPAQTALTDDARDAQRYRWLRDTLHGAKAGGGVEVNDALQVYEKPTPGAEVRIYWYQDTPVGFYEVHGTTLDEAIDAALTAAQSASGGA